MCSAKRYFKWPSHQTGLSASLVLTYATIQARLFFTAKLQYLDFSCNLYIGVSSPLRAPLDVALASGFCEHTPPERLSAILYALRGALPQTDACRVASKEDRG